MTRVNSIRFVFPSLLVLLWLPVLLFCTTRLFPCGWIDLIFLSSCFCLVLSFSCFVSTRHVLTVSLSHTHSLPFRTPFSVPFLCVCLSSFPLPYPPIMLVNVLLFMLRLPPLILFPSSCTCYACVSFVALHGLLCVDSLPLSTPTPSFPFPLSPPLCVYFYPLVPFLHLRVYLFLPLYDSAPPLCFYLVFFLILLFCFCSLLRLHFLLIYTHQICLFLVSSNHVFSSLFFSLCMVRHINRQSENWCGRRLGV